MLLTYKLRPENIDEFVALVNEVTDELKEYRSKNPAVSTKMLIDDLDSTIEVKVLDLEERVN